MSSRKQVSSLNELVKEMMGKRMTKAQFRLEDELRRKVKAGQLTIVEAHEIWDKLVLNKEKKKP